MEIQESVPLKNYTTFHIGGPARFFCTANSVEEIKEALAFAREKNLAVLVLGGGSNSFGGLTIAKLTNMPSNANGSYILSPDPVPGGTTSITITGTGIERGNDGATPVEIEMTVWADSLFMVANN